MFSWKQLRSKLTLRATGIAFLAVGVTLLVASLIGEVLVTPAKTKNMQHLSDNLHAAKPYINSVGLILGVIGMAILLIYLFKRLFGFKN